ncbi:MAG: hypothetical protein WD648_15215 [Planctomycetaceae bacterium]
MKPHIVRLSIVFSIGFVIGAAVLALLFNNDRTPVAHAQQSSSPREADLAALQAEVERLKQVVPDQAHAMQDVDYHFTNLWFAANQSNWPLAQFYFNETRSHLRWAVRIIPVRKDNSGKEVKLQDILQAVENSPLKQLEEAIQAKDREKFVAAFEFTLTSCYACHKASDKPYLRPRIPDHPSSAMMNFDPNATWPK